MAKKTVTKNPECSGCGGDVRIERGNYEFKECGLPGVVLQGIEIVRCPECGDTPIIPRLNDLMHTLALAVISQPYRLQGSDVRFLRKYLRKTGEEFAQLISVDKTTLSKWENSADPVGDQSDRLIRAIVMLSSEELKEKRQHLLLHLGQIRKTNHKVKIHVKANAPRLSYEYA